MRYTIVILSCFFICAFQQSEIYPYRKMLPDDMLVLTYDKNNDVVSWENSDRRIAFTSNFKGTNNIYFIDLMQLAINKGKKGFYSAKYVDELVEKEKVFVPLTQGKDTAFSDPFWHPQGRKLLCLGTYNGRNELFITNRSTYQVIPTGVSNVVCFNWKSDNQLYIVKKTEPKTLYQIDLDTKNELKITTSEFDILGINPKKDKLILACLGAVVEFSLSSSTNEIFKMPVNGKNADHLKKLNFLVRSDKGEAMIFDLNNNNSFPLFAGGQDNAPQLSNDGKYIAFYSDFLQGIIIKKLNRSF